MKIPNKDDGDEENNEPTDQEVTIDESRMANLENPFLETIPSVIRITPSVSKATAVSTEAILVVSPEIDLQVSVLLVIEVGSDVLTPVEFVCNVSKSSDVIIAPPQTRDE